MANNQPPDHARIIEIQVNHPTTTECAAQLARLLKLKSRGERIRGGLIYSTIELDAAAFKAKFDSELPDVDYLAMTSCLGVSGSGQFQTGQPALASLWFVGDCDLGISCLSSSAKVDSGLADAALDKGNLSASDANFAIVCPTPGHEEKILNEVYKSLSKKTPIIGGSAADNDLSGQWRVWTNKSRPSAEGVALLVGRWPGSIGTAYTGGYLPTSSTGKITKAVGRSLISIDNKPAAEVYNDWLGNGLAQELESGGSILQQSTLSPLGVVRDKIGAIPTYVLAHPESLNKETGSVELFCEVYQGEEIVLMTSSKPALLRRPKLVLNQAMRRARVSADSMESCLMIYCAGCMLAVQDEINALCANYRDAVGPASKLVAFTFGEQGNIVKQRWDHGNLMTSVMVFGKTG